MLPGGPHLHAVDLLTAIRTASEDDAAGQVVRLLQRGVAPNGVLPRFFWLIPFFSARIGH